MKSKLKEIFAHVQTVLYCNLKAIQEDNRVTLEELLRIKSVHKIIQEKQTLTPFKLFKAYVSTAITLDSPYIERCQFIVNSIKLSEADCVEMLEWAIDEKQEQGNYMLREILMLQINDHLNRAPGMIDSWFSKQMKEILASKEPSKSESAFVIALTLNRIATYTFSSDKKQDESSKLNFIIDLLSESKSSPSDLGKQILQVTTLAILFS